MYMGSGGNLHAFLILAQNGDELSLPRHIHFIPCKGTPVTTGSDGWAPEPV